MGFTISDAQLQHFRDQGYLIIESVFDAAELARLRDEADFILELMINSSDFHQRRSGRLDITACPATGGALVRKIQPINDLGLALTAAARDERLIAPMRALMEDEPVLMEEKLNGKQPVAELPAICAPRGDRVDSRFPVHNDWAYYAKQDYPQSIISSAISLDDCTPDSGPLRVWPGSHREHREHEAIPGLGLQVKPGLIDFDGGIDVLAPAGSVMFFHSLLVHNSRANESGRARRLMIYSHYPRSANMGHDVRNGPGRLHESPFELAYLRARAEGRYHDVFSLARQSAVTG